MGDHGNTGTADPGRAVIWDLDRDVFASLVEQAEAEQRSRGDMASVLIRKGLNPHTVELNPVVLAQLDQMAKGARLSRHELLERVLTEMIFPEYTFLAMRENMRRAQVLREREEVSQLAAQQETQTEETADR